MPYKIRIKKMMGKKQYETNRKITYKEVAEAVGLSPATLANMALDKPYNTTLGTLEKLQHYFGCSLTELVEYVHDGVGRAFKRSNTHEKPRRSR